MTSYVLDDVLASDTPLAAASGGAEDATGRDTLADFFESRIHAVRYLAAEVEAFMVGRRELGDALAAMVVEEERHLANLELLRDQHGDTFLPSRDLLEKERFALGQELRAEYVARWRDLVQVHTQWRVLSATLSGLERRGRLVQYG
ncbi:MAG: hypothetical protein IT379_11875 [Deltaproteobacteria bacterium]|nr:hypothetical protein [Deltaproteobacteria bacterium]